MKRLVFLIVFICYFSMARSQDTLYKQLLNNTRELAVGDSLRLDELTGGIKLDSSFAKRFFQPLLSTGNSPFKNRTYLCLGRITDHENYDLYIIMEDRRRADSTGMTTSYLVTLKKTGGYISSQKVAVTGTKKKTGYNIRSTLFKENRIYIDSRITTGEKYFEEEENYRITKTGRFMLVENAN